MKKTLILIALIALAYAGAQVWRRARMTEAQRAIETMQANWSRGIYADNLDIIEEGGAND